MHEFCQTLVDARCGDFFFSSHSSAQTVVRVKKKKIDCSLIVEWGAGFNENRKYTFVPSINLMFDWFFLSFLLI